jgi:hypothetical protein
VDVIRLCKLIWYDEYLHVLNSGGPSSSSSSSLLKQQQQAQQQQRGGGKRRMEGGNNTSPSSSLNGIKHDNAVNERNILDLHYQIYQRKMNGYSIPSIESSRYDSPSLSLPHIFIFSISLFFFFLFLLFSSFFFFFFTYFFFIFFLDFFFFMKNPLVISSSSLQSFLLYRNC